MLLFLTGPVYCVVHLQNIEFVDCSYELGEFEVSTEIPGLPVEYSVNEGQTWTKVSKPSLRANKTATYLFVTR